MGNSIKKLVKVSAATLVIAGLSSGCVQEKVFNHGPVITQDQLDLVPTGSSQEQVLLALGSPSSRGQFGNDVFYYISQQRVKTYRFEKPKLVDQKVLAVYFDEEQTVSRVANYGLQDGKVFDFVSRTTPTGGADVSFLGQLLRGSSGKSGAQRALGGGTGAPPGF